MVSMDRRSCLCVYGLCEYSEDVSGRPVPSYTSWVLGGTLLLPPCGPRGATGPQIRWALVIVASCLVCPRHGVYTCLYIHMNTRIGFVT